jgi:hypothetical protein
MSHDDSYVSLLPMFSKINFFVCYGDFQRLRFNLLLEKRFNFTHFSDCWIFKNIQSSAWENQKNLNCVKSVLFCPKRTLKDIFLFVTKRKFHSFFEFSCCDQWWVSNLKGYKNPIRLWIIVWLSLFSLSEKG